MKILVIGKTPRQKMDGTIGSCVCCKVQIEITCEDILEYFSDQKDGDSWTIKCPTVDCNRTIFFETR